MIEKRNMTDIIDRLNAQGIADYEYDLGICKAATEEIRRLRGVNHDLLEALERIVEFNRQTARDKYGDPNVAETWACVITARAAIAKAKGEADNGR
ncbi:hypothetical protein HGA64_03715 [Candidatus Falkowbacteria bacterium]|nr:hypothetical protein [Candidatus Falkowbacteria bacterium]